MKVICQFARNNLKYSLGLITILLFVIQICHIVKEGEKHVIQTETSGTTEQDCPKRIDIWVSVFKCSLAFLFGGLLSDLKFLKFGVI